MTLELVIGLAGAIISILLVVVAFFAQSIIESVRDLIKKIADIEKFLTGTEIYMKTVLKKQEQFDEQLKEFEKGRNDFYREYGSLLEKMKKNDG